MLLPRDANGALLAPTSLVNDAHAANLQVHAWTLRAENYFLPKDFQQGSDPAQLGNLEAEIKALLNLGLDGFFSDHPALAVAARAAWRNTKAR
jgi:glycerophosphoryl diester phosphodiesterase